jgi:hypothetical protein
MTVQNTTRVPGDATTWLPRKPDLLRSPSCSAPCRSWPTVVTTGEGDSGGTTIAKLGDSIRKSSSSGRWFWDRK